jgi:hypothetical protein
VGYPRMLAANPLLVSHLNPRMYNPIFFPTL